jgi:TRAP-type C4-dicarboxylate transport system substrate-binding protein
MRHALVAALVCWTASTARAEPEALLKFATTAPDGTMWARNFRAFAKKIEQATAGHVKIKWYFGAVTGDDIEQLERMQRGQLDGAIGTMLCTRVSPSMAITRLLAVFQTRDEANHVMNLLEPTFEAEAAKNGYVMTGSSGLGPDFIFTRTPVHDMAELRKLTLWRWDIDPIGTASARAMGLKVVTAPVDQAGRAFDEGRVDGFMTVPSVALAFQWFTQAHYLIDLRTTYVWGCAVMREQSFKRLPIAYQEVLREATAEVRERNEEALQRIDEALLGGLFASHGMRVVPVSDAFRAEFFAAARRARQEVAAQIGGNELFTRVQGMLADYRAEHPEGGR